jgi:hypothetical protein
MCNKIILCHHKGHTGIHESDAKNYKEWLVKYKAHHKKHKGIDYNCLSDANKVRIKKQILQSLAHSSANDSASLTITDNTNRRSNKSTPSPWTPNFLVFIVDVSMLFYCHCKQETSSGTHHDQLPHIHLKLGTDLDNKSCPEVHAIIYTAAALSTGNFHFILATTKKFSHYLTKLYVPDNYNPIVLSGIVQRSGKYITTKLTVGSQIHFPYPTHSG